MRQVLRVGVLLLLASTAFGQATVIGGWATNLGPAGWYPATPFVPVVTTPMISLQNFSPSPVGASNATAGNVAGATNSTLSIVAPAMSASYTVPVWYGYGTAAPIITVAAPPAAPAEAARAKAYFESGVARLGKRGGIADAVKVAKAQTKPAKRTYTNEDIDRINQQKGTVKWDGKTEHIG